MMMMMRLAGILPWEQWTSVCSSCCTWWIWNLYSVCNPLRRRFCYMAITWPCPSSNTFDVYHYCSTFYFIDAFWWFNFLYFMLLWSHCWKLLGPVSLRKHRLLSVPVLLMWDNGLAIQMLILCLDRESPSNLPEWKISSFECIRLPLIMILWHFFSLHSESVLGHPLYIMGPIRTGPCAPHVQNCVPSNKCMILRHWTLYFFTQLVCRCILSQ